MPVMLSAFDNKLGPICFMVLPGNLESNIVKRIVDTFDISVETDDIIVKDFGDMGIKSFNLQFKIVSPIARGGHDLVQASIITTEANPPENMIKEKLFDLKKKITSRSDAYKGLYEKIGMTDTGKNGQLSEKDIHEEYGFLRSLIEDLESETAIGIQKTEAFLKPPSSILRRKAIPIPPSFVNEMKRMSFSKEKSKFFVVFRNDGTGNVILNVLMTDKKVFLLQAEVESLDPQALLHLRKAIPLECIYTNGFCQKTCRYEAYFSFEGKFEEVKEVIASRMKAVPSLKRYDLKLISDK